MLLLAACDSTVGTTGNPNLNTGASGYTGPPAKTEDIRSFERNFWTYLKEDSHCGECHGVDQPPTFVNKSNVNAAYAEAIKIVDLLDESSSEIVAQAATGHYCWLGPTNGADCALSIAAMIKNWATDSDVTSARLITLTPPIIKAPGDAKSFPPFTDPEGAAFATTVHPILLANCQNCHQETATPLPIAPFFANASAASAYEAAKPKMDIDSPDISRLVVRLRQEAHNCWTNNCENDAQDMEDQIIAFAGGIGETSIDDTLKTSKALNFADGIVAAGGNRHESNQFAIWEFRTNGGNQTFDTSGIEPAISMNINGSYRWLGGYGLDLTNGYAMADNNDSDKLKTFIEATGEYAIEAWVIPANVTQQNANIVSYSDGTGRNFAIGQEMYNYEFYNRYDEPDPLSNPLFASGEPMLTTGDSGEELLQSSLQHIVANYDPINGRSVYINGALVDNNGASIEPIPTPTSIGNVVWDHNFVFLLGADIAGANNWDGMVRMVAMHNRTLTQEQVTQNFELGVGEKFYLLFFVGHHWGESDTDPKSFILIEVSQFDDYGYLFSTPTFINLDPSWVPNSISIKGLRIGINGKEAVAGQAYANIDTTINAVDYDPQLGQQLSPLGTIIALEKSAATDEFFLTFENIGGQIHDFVDARPAAPPTPVDPALPVVSDIGMRTFEEISATISAITGIPVNDIQTFNGNTVSVKGTYDSYIQQLPTVESIDAFLPSHQMAVAQLALASCNTLVEMEAINPGFFQVEFPTGVFNPLNMNQLSVTAFGNPPVASHYTTPIAGAGATLSPQQIANRAGIVNTMTEAALNADLLTPANNLTTQPDIGQVPTPTLPDVPGISGMLGAEDTQTLGIAASDYESLVSNMLGCRPPVTLANPNPTCMPTPDSTDRTKQIVKAVCAAAVGSATMLVQ